MDIVGQPERATQNRVLALFRNELGYRYLGDWTDRDGNGNIEEGLLSAWLAKCGYTSTQISVALYKLRIEADNHTRTLYGNNQAVYNLLRYGVPVKTEAGKVTETVHLINWHEPEANDFAIAEEVTLKGDHDRRPDIVLYVNGIAVGVLELKNSHVTIGDGIRQCLRTVPEDSLQGQIRRGEVLQPAGKGRDARGNRRQHRDRQAVHLQHLHRAAEGRRRQAGHDQDRDPQDRRGRQESSPGRMARCSAPRASY